MLVTFRSTATDSITLFGDTASQLLRLMGASGRVPGAFEAEDVPGALQQLQAGLARLEARLDAAPSADEQASAEAEDQDQDERDKEPPVQLATRAVPLIDLLKRAAAARAEVLWEPGG